MFLLVLKALHVSALFTGLHQAVHMHNLKHKHVKEQILFICYLVDLQSYIEIYKVVQI